MVPRPGIDPAIAAATRTPLKLLHTAHSRRISASLYPHICVEPNLLILYEGNMAPIDRNASDAEQSSSASSVRGKDGEGLGIW